ncbi:A-kinase anchor protein 5 isoform X3 [Equus asinus]|uniref:A-kinase anchor protein 5 isoform X3 n=1 Tax=Equus asinus TaxID=9793 RepID=UPI0038F686EB
MRSLRGFAPGLGAPRAAPAGGHAAGRWPPIAPCPPPGPRPAPARPLRTHWCGWLSVPALWGGGAAGLRSLCRGLLAPGATVASRLPRRLAPRAPPDLGSRVGQGPRRLRVIDVQVSFSNSCLRAIQVDR